MHPSSTSPHCDSRVNHAIRKPPEKKKFSAVANHLLQLPDSSDLVSLLQRALQGLVGVASACSEIVSTLPVEEAHEIMVPR